jgi:hypothetical protein
MVKGTAWDIESRPHGVVKLPLFPARAAIVRCDISDIRTIPHKAALHFAFRTRNADRKGGGLIALLATRCN